MTRLLIPGFALALVVGIASACCGEGVPCAGTSTVWAQNYSPCVGDTVEIYGIVKDCYENPLQGRTVTFYTSRGSTDQIIGPSPVTDSKGFAKSKVTTAVGGTCQIYYEVQGTIVGPSPSVGWDGASPVGYATWGLIKALYR